jgi:hypothetical protein
MMSILLVLLFPVSPLARFSSLLQRNGFVVVGFPLQCRFSVLVELFISQDTGVSRSPHENQVLLPRWIWFIILTTLGL